MRLVVTVEEEEVKISVGEFLCRLIIELSIAIVILIVLG